MLRVTHFEISVDDPERAIKFYADAFGWKIKKWEGPMDYWLITTGPEDQPGIDGGLMKREHPGASTTNTIDVPSVDEFISKITEAGGKIVAPKQSIPGVGYFAYCQDTEGNTFGIMEEDTSAK
ncbi:MAG: VOC family protein [Spirochaetes bacterium]|nr:VOC family protein [Spirochaetota bacterium]